MIKIVVDTNIIVSAAIGKSYPALVVNRILEVDFELCLSSDILAEYERVTQCPKLTKQSSFKENSKKLLNSVNIFGVLYYPQISLSVLTDHSDNKFLELAITANANYLITGNHLHFNFENFQGVKIVSAKTFWELYQQNSL